MSVELTPQFSIGAVGTTAQRPAQPALGQIYFDTTLAPAGKPIFCSTQFVPPATPAVWVDGTGTAV